MPTSSAAGSLAGADGAAAANSSAAHAATAPSDAEQPSTIGEKSAERQRWSSKAEFLITLVGYAVGLGNFWRFPYLCYKYGGGAFLVPYTIVLIVVGMPLFCLELGVGQKYQLGPLQLWGQIHPMLGGLGWASTAVTFFVALYYNVIVAWAFWYLGNSFQSPLPWAEERAGATEFWEIDTLGCRPIENGIGAPLDDYTANTCSWDLVYGPEAPAGADAGVYPRLFDAGGIVWPLFGCLLGAWALIYLCVCKGIASVGKVAWFTAIFPYVVLSILLVRGVTLPGAADGLAFYLTPEWSKLADSRVWIAAASQIFYSLGVGWGTIVAFASYNEPSHNFVRDAWMVPLINCGTSFLAGIVVFSILGYMANQKGVSVADVAEGGTGLAFVVYPEALARMPGAPIFSVLFFFMIVCLGVDSQFAMVETVMTALKDAKLTTLRKEALSGLVCGAMCLLGFVFVTRAGVHWLELVDTFVANLALFAVGTLECVAVGWVYGAQRFAADTIAMCGRALPKPLLWAYKWVIPLLLCALSLQSAIDAMRATYAFPIAGIGFGWALSVLCVLPLPYFALRHAPYARCAAAVLRRRARPPIEVPTPAITEGATPKPAEGGGVELGAVKIERRATEESMFSATIDVPKDSPKSPEPAAAQPYV